MEYISSDTNIWIDFNTVDSLDVPFMLREDFTYIMSSDTVNDELQSPPELKERLIELGLKITEMQEEEFQLLMKYSIYEKLSVYDRIALSIAKNRKIILLSGDRNLRIAAGKEGVEVHGSLWILDRIIWSGKLTETRIKKLLNDFLLNCGKKIRLPRIELENRLKQIVRCGTDITEMKVKRGEN